MEQPSAEKSPKDAAPINIPEKFPSLCVKDQQQLMLQNLPEVVKRRLNALKKLQLVNTHIEAEFFKEIHALECKYQAKYKPLYEKREKIVSGEYEPTDKDCDFIHEPYSLSEEATEYLSQLKLDDFEPFVGIPNFWLTIFKNVALLSDMIQPHDEPILKHLVDIKVVFLEKNPMGFILEFYFSPNEFFTNKVLTKSYEMKCDAPEINPFEFEGPEIYKCKGCVIDWNKGKNITVKTIKKRQKHRSKGSFRTVLRSVQTDSFFNFFSPPTIPEDTENDMDENTHVLLNSDFEIGHFIREHIVPHAVLYYTGEALDDEDDFEEEEDTEEFNTSESDENAEDDKPEGPNPAGADCFPANGGNKNSNNKVECAQQ